MTEVDVPRLLAALGIDARRKGDEWKALCPMPEHDDRHPSWGIVDAPGGDRHGFWKCWGCGRSGGPVRLVRRVLGWEAEHPDRVREWLEEVGAGGGLMLPREVEVVVRLPQVPKRFRMPPGVLEEPLDRWPGPVRAYAESRGLTAEQVARWEIGYSLEGRLEGRLVIPVKSARGVLAGYQARTFVGALIRYKTPDLSENPDQRVLFGEYHWPTPAERRGGVVAVSEGALDALALERAGAPHVAALSGGGGFSEMDGVQVLAPHVAALLGGWGRVIRVTDGDAAGRSMGAALEGALGRHVEVRELCCPYGQDACSARPEWLREALGRLL